MKATEASGAGDDVDAVRRWAERVGRAAATPGPGSPGWDGWWSAALPFSFRYGGIPSAELVSRWRRRQELQARPDDHAGLRLHLTDPQTNLEVTWEATCYADMPAVEWLVRIRNGGTGATPILEAIRALDLVLATDYHD